MALIGWTTWRALSYLVISLIHPSAAPAAITELPTRMDESFLRTERTAWRGVDATENPRMPPAHYHRIDSWVQPDPFNGCTAAGCHNPIPHNRRKEVRAFLNMHATSIHCGVCHMRTEHRPLDLTWYDLDTGAACDPPSILQIYDLLTSPRKRRALQTPTEADQRNIVALLRAAAEQADGLPALEQLAEHFAAVRAASGAFQSLIEVGRSTLPRHFRGEYGAKLALSNPQDRTPQLAHPDTADAVRNYLRHADSIPPVEHDTLLAAIHPLRRAQALTCIDCHREAESLVSFSAAGYPPARIKALTRPIVFQMVEHISAGRPMHLGLPWISPNDGQPNKQDEGGGE